MSDGVTFSTVKEVEQVEAFERSLQQLNTMLKSVDKSDFNALRRAVKTVATSSSEMLQNLASSADESGRKLRKLMNSLEDQANLSFSTSIREQTQAIQKAYEAQLAVVGKLTNEEIRLWKARGANIGALQRQQLAEAEAAAKAIQSFVARQNASAAATPGRASAGLAAIRPAGAADKLKADSAEALAALREYYTAQETLATATLKASNAEMERVTRKEASESFKRRSQAIKEAAATEAQALQSSAEMLTTMRQFYTLQDSGIREEMARVSRKEASAAFKARSQAIKEAAALEAAELNKSPEMLALMSRFYTQQDASARAERDRVYRKEASAEFKARSAAIKAERESLTGDNSGAMAELRSQYTSTAGMVAMEALRASVNKLDPKPVHTLSDAFKKLTVDGNDVHSMARGLASGFNLLWLTWGNLAPLFAGAAISFGVKSVVTLGAEVQNTMETIRVLSEESRSSVANLNEQMLELARSGPFGPLEVAKAMKTLSLAGLSAAEVGSSIKDVLNFAVAGDTSIEKAADVMTSVATAFSISAKGYNYVGDIIAKTAAVSKSSVDSIGEAFKTASVINKQYGVSLQDVGVGLAALSNLGIQGTAAGTALRNMYVDLSGRTPKVEKALAKFNLELRDSNGRFKDVITIAQNFNTVLDNMQSNIDKKKYLQDVLSERGAKPIIELLDLARSAAKETGSSVNSALEEMRNKIMDSYGFVVIAAAEMALTPLNQMKSVTATLQATLVEAFDGLAPVILDVSSRLKNAFNSEEAKSGISNLMTAVANLTVTVVTHLDTIALLGAGYLVFKGAQVATALMLGLERQLVTATGAMTAFTLSSALNGSSLVGVAGAATSALGWLTKLAGFLTPLTAVVTAGYLAWELYGMFVGRAGKAADDNLGANYHDQLIKQLQSETARLNENTEAMLANMSVEELRSKKGSEELAKKSRSGIESAISDSEAKLASLEMRLQEAKGFTNDSSKAYFGTGAVKSLEKQVALEKSSLEYHKETLAVMQITEDINKQQVKDAAKSNTTVAEYLAEAKRKKAEDALGSAKYEKATRPEGLGGRGRQISVPEVTNRLTQIEQEGAAALAIAQSNYEKERQILEGRHQAGIVSEGLYQAQLTQLLISSEEERLAIIKDEESQRNAERDATVAKEVERLNMELANFKGKADDRAAYVVSKSMETQGRIDKINAQVQASEMKDAKDRAKIEDDKYMRMQKAANEYAGKVFKLQEEQRLASEAISRANIREESNRQLAGKFDVVTENTMAFMRAQKAAEEAALQMSFKVEDSLIKTTDEYKKAQKAAEDFTLAALASGRWNDPEVVAGLQRLQAEVARLEALLAQSASDGTVQIANAASQAFNKVIDQDLARLKQSTADALMTALFDGANAGKKKLRDILISELRKPIRLVVDLAINAFASLFTGGSGGGSVISTGANLLNTGSNGLSLATLATTGFNTASTAGAFGANFVAGASQTLGISGAGSTAAATSAASAAAGQGTAASLGSTLGTAAPYIAAAYIAYRLINSATSGEQRAGGQYGYAFNGSVVNNRRGNTVTGNQATFLEGPSGGDPNSLTIKTGINSTVDTTNALLAQYGSKERLTGFQAGYETSDRGRGGVFSGGTLSNGKTFGASGKGDNYEGTLFKKIYSQSPDAKQALLDFTTDLQRSTLEALQAANLGEEIGKFLDSLGDMEQLTSAEVKTNYDLAMSYSMINAAVKSMPFEYLIKMSVKAAGKLAEMAGGADVAVNLISNFFNKFGTAQEKSDQLAKNTAQGFAAINLTMPKSTEGLRDWYKSEVARLGAMDLSVEANAKAYVAILKLADGVDALAAAAEETARTRQSWQDKLDLMLGRKTQEEIDLKNDLAGVTDEATRAIIKQIYAENARRAALQKAVDDAEDAYAKARESFDRAIDKERKRLTDIQTAQKATVDNLQGIFDLLDSAAKDLYQQIATTANLSALSANDLLDAAIQTGILPEKAALSEAIANAKAGVASTIYGSQAEADYAKNVLAGKLATLAQSAGEQLSPAEKALKLTEAQLDDLDKLVEQMDEMIDAARGIDTGIKDVATATRELKSAISTLGAAISAQLAYQAQQAEQARLSNALTGGLESQAQRMSTKPLSASGSGAFVTGGGKGDGPGNFYSETNLGNGVFQQQITDPAAVARLESIQTSVSEMFGAGIPKFAKGGFHAGGLRLVGENGPEVEATGPARYWTATQTAVMMNGGSSGSSVSASGIDIAEEIRQLRIDNKLLSQNMQIIANAFDGKQKVSLRVEIA